MQTFGFSPGTRAVTMVGIVFLVLSAIGIALFFMSAPDSTKGRNGLALVVAPFGLFIVFSIRFYRRMKDQVLASDQGLTYQPFSGKAVSVTWDKITGMRPHDLRRRYDVLGPHGDCIMRLSYELDQFEQLDAIIREHFKKRSSDGRTTFIKKYSAGGKTLVAASCGILIFSLLDLWLKGVNLKDLFLTFLSGGGITLGLYFVVERLVVTREGVIIQYLRRNTIIPFSTIQRLSFQGESASSQSCTIDIDRLHQKPYRLGWQGAEAPMLCQAIETAWKQSTSTQRATAIPG